MNVRGHRPHPDQEVSHPDPELGRLRATVAKLEEEAKGLRATVQDKTTTITSLQHDLDWARRSLEQSANTFKKLNRENASLIEKHRDAENLLMTRGIRLRLQNEFPIERQNCLGVSNQDHAAGNPSVVEAEWKQRLQLKEEEHKERLRQAREAYDKDIQNLAAKDRREREDQAAIHQKELEKQRNVTWKLDTDKAGLKNECKEKEAQIRQGEFSITRLEKNNRTLCQAYKAKVMRIRQLEESKAALEAFLGSRLTPRMIILAKIAAERVSRLDSNGSGDRFLQACTAQELSATSLDVPLEDDKLLRFTRDLHANSGKLEIGPSLDVQVCAVCKSPKFANTANTAGPNARLNEFPVPVRGVRPITRCCNTICSACLLRCITESLHASWFSNLGRSKWFKCPVADCDEFLDIPHVAELGNLLRRLGSPDVAAQIAIYERAVVLHNALEPESLKCRPTRLALEKAAALHSRLISRNMMRSFFDPSVQSSQPDEEGKIPQFTAGPIRMFDVDHEDGKLSVPIFMKFLRRKTVATGRRCSGCSEVWCDLDFTTIGEWIETCKGFTGDWMWKILVFPEKLAGSCGHEIDHCNNCLAEHMKVKLEELGRGVADNMPCPSEGCNRKLEYQEVMLYGDRESLIKYDKYLLLNSITALPNFRWCGRGACGNGQLYEEDDELITCDECGFAMCYRHQIPFHRGLTCEQYDSQREHGDPSYKQTQEWISKNSKPCPGVGCGVNITKGEACFHMTCVSCGHEFCWECLASWANINPEPGRYRASAHTVNCFFRTSRLMPTQIMGMSIDDALGDGE
ncbi:hypothetical protein QBC46DRAFT_301019 [Diplogelasinospora grovesii]|uniref:RBR-type E3 ubiquitin transferase n=1 Tax=Diplogelasinospora grovesii TaxID=303347 RepID=A0AAN6MU90_9PEZI|nr:hypothetical protein QBC46DRAFT_301019 [Diplogelasinospora grovesii]